MEYFLFSALIMYRIVWYFCVSGLHKSIVALQVLNQDLGGFNLPDVCAIGE